MLAIVLGVVCFISLVGCGILFLYLRRTASFLFDLEDVIAEMYDAILESKNRIHKINEMPIANDSPEVRFVVESVREIEELIGSISYNVLEVRKKKDQR